MMAYDDEPQAETRDYWQLLESAPDYATETAALFNWSANYDPGKGPATLFLDLIGWSDENLGAPLYSLEDAQGKLGYMELDYLADALKEYTKRPSDVLAFVESLMAAEARS